MAFGMEYQPSSGFEFNQMMLADPSYQQPSVAASVGGIHPLSRDEVKAMVVAGITDSIAIYGSPVHQQRRTNLRRYYGKPFGNEVVGHSQAQINAVANTVEWMMPALIDAVVAGEDNIWDFQPTRPGEEAMADLASDVCNHIFMHECNGFSRLHDIIKTAILEKVGYLAIYFDERMKPQRETMRGVTEQMLGMIMQDPNTELMEFGPHRGEVISDPQTGQPLETFDVTVRRVTPIGRIRIDSIAPEHILIPRRETELDDETVFCGYRKKMTVGELISLGFDPEIVSVLPADNSAEFAEGRIERLYDESSFPTNLQNKGDGASRELWVNFIWMRVDEDGDGFAELRHIICVGESSIDIIHDEETNYIPLVSLCPIPMPHKFHGMCPADQAVDKQMILSTLVRLMLDNAYRVGNGRYAVLEDQVNIKDLVENKPGGAVRVEQIGACTALETPNIPPFIFDLMGFMQGELERSTGVSSWQQGPDAADMKYQTDGGVSKVQTASESKITLINQVFAQTGIKQIGKKILHLLCSEYAGPFVFRLRGEWINCDPRAINKNMDCTVHPGMGKGEMEAKTQKLMLIGSLQKDYLTSGARDMVKPKHLYRTATDLVKTLGLGREGTYFADPGDSDWPQPQPDFQTQVKLMESQRRSLEDRAKDNQETMTLAVKADSQESMARFRYDELAAKSEIDMAQMINARQIAEIQIAGQIRAAMANQHQHSHGAN